MRAGKSSNLIHGQVSEGEPVTTSEHKPRLIAEVELEIARLLLESAMELLARENASNVNKGIEQSATQERASLD